MKVKNKILTLIIGISTLCMIAIPNNVNAALQANGATPTTASLESWLVNIRKMETTGGTLGLTDTINTTSLESSAEKSNNIDIHMQKNTEYGAMAILSASAYGNQEVIASGDTTTGNKTGIYINLNYEWVAAGQLASSAVFGNANGKYKNVYTTTYSAKVGDAIGEITNGDVGTSNKVWHSSTDYTSYWINNASQSGLTRACYGSIFSYNGSGNSTVWDYAYYGCANWSRAVIVVGSGF